MGDGDLEVSPGGKVPQGVPRPVTTTSTDTTGFMIWGYGGDIEHGWTESSVESELDDEEDDQSDSEDEDEGEPASDAYLSDSISLPFVNLPISRKGLTSDDFMLPTREQFIEDQDNVGQLKQIRKWVEAKTRPSADELALYSAIVKSFVQMFDEIAVRDGLLDIRRNDDTEREQTVVPCARVDEIIRYFHQRAGGAHQAPKATSAKIIPRF